VGWAGLCPVDGLKKNGPASELAKPFCLSPSLPWQRPPQKSPWFLNCGHLSRRIPQEADCPQFKNLFGFYQWFNPLDNDPPKAA